MTIKDLAAMTGYSVGTVSRVLNDHPNVSDTARQTILRAVQDSGFQLNTNAKQLKQQHSNAILVVAKGTSNELYGSLLEVIQSQLSGTRYSLHVDYMDEDANEVLRAVQLCREKKPRGILFLGGNRHHFQKDFSKIDVPCVLVTNNAEALQYPNLSSVSTDDKAAARCAMETLLAWAIGSSPLSAVTAGFPTPAACAMKAASNPCGSGEFPLTRKRLLRCPVLLSGRLPGYRAAAA